MTGKPFDKFVPVDDGTNLNNVTVVLLLYPIAMRFVSVSCETRTV